jgi:hypothetical protein
MSENERKKWTEMPGMQLHFLNINIDCTPKNILLFWEDF